ncbi:MAG: hypothetical protein PVG70_03255 [Desulfobacterales bacterium]
MSDLTHQRCYNHMFREAAARCPECARFFCRECITEHEDKVLCSSCLHKRLKPTDVKISRFQWMLNLGYFFLGLLLLYVLFFYFGRILLLLPSSFHEGTLWKIG